MRGQGAAQRHDRDAAPCPERKPAQCLAGEVSSCRLEGHLTVVVGGLVTSTLLTLLVVPALYRVAFQPRRLAEVPA